MLLRSELLCAQTLLGEATYPLEELESGDIQSLRVTPPPS